MLPMTLLLSVPVPHSPKDYDAKVDATHAAYGDALERVRDTLQSPVHTLAEDRQR